MKTISVMIVDDHAMVRTGLKQWLEHEPDIKVVAEGCCGNDVPILLSTFKPDVLLLDLHLPDKDGHEVVRELRAVGSDLQILVMTGDGREHARGAFNAGANGFLTKGESRERFVEAIRWAAGGELGTWVSLDETTKQGKIDRVIAHAGLTKTDMKILALLHLSNSEISAKLFLSIGTVKNHVTCLYCKLGVHTRIAAHEWAFENGIGS